MQGWIKLAETYRKPGSSSQESNRLSTNRNLNNINNNKSSTQQETLQNSYSMTTNTNGHMLTTTDTINPLDSPPNIFDSASIISVESSPRNTNDDISLIDLEPPLSPRLMRDHIPIIDLESTTATTQSLSPSTRSTGIPNKKNTFLFYFLFLYRLFRF